MKKTLLLLTTLLFSLSANAASINARTSVFNNVQFTNNDTNSVTANATYSNAFQSTVVPVFLTTDVDTLVKFDFVFNDLPANPGRISFSQPITGMVTTGESFAITPSLTFTRMLFAGQTANIIPRVGAAGSYSLDITALPSEVPVPAALLLFAPALLGFLGLRRKAAKNANTVATA